jgi:hypothetical protein
MLLIAVQAAAKNPNFDFNLIDVEVATTPLITPDKFTVAHAISVLRLASNLTEKLIYSFCSLI